MQITENKQAAIVTFAHGFQGIGRLAGITTTNVLTKTEPAQTVG